MSLTAQIQDDATPILTQAIASLEKARPLMAAAGKRVVNEMRKHFRTRQGQGNKQGWPDRNFWYGATTASVSQNTSLADFSDTHASVVIADVRFAHKVKGGEIKPKRGKYLALPVRLEAYVAGSPREGNITGLFFVRALGRAYLAKRDGKKLSVYYRLVKSVNQPADPDAMPAQGVLESAIDDEANKYIQRLLRKGGQA